MKLPIIGFIIPAYNEEVNIRNTILSINKYVPAKFNYEITIVDHGSTDRTVEVANSMGANVTVHPTGTIAALRNYGVRLGKGKILVFIDADVQLTSKWSNRIEDVIPSLLAGERVLTGSWVGVPENANWIEKNWFKPLQKGESTHINSGHLIIARQLFQEIGGFREDLETGEDYEFSMRAKISGLSVVDDPLLKVVHQGYPKSLREFVSREFWHGKGDSISLTAITGSKVASISLLFFGLHLLIAISLHSEAYYIVAAISVVLVLFLMVSISAVKYRAEPVTVILVNSFLYYCYFWARFTSILVSVWRKQPVKRKR